MEPSYIDIHAHVHFAAFDGDRDEVVDRTRRGKTWMINVGTKRDTSQAALMLAKEKGEGLYATVGLHPIHTGKSFHDTQETGEGGKAFVSRNEEFSYDFYESSSHWRMRSRLLSARAAFEGNTTSGIY